ncbi:polyprenol monophosphomannose synthase [Actinomadura sp. ATCC 31491]|uniref:Polyprenol monophosphomannose synthase n=1 Tax=Actinomadura luzonensis TaxID=2805427 RepID=A0ABT0FLR9_9ACTN|nr:polyprenol monophosphomannose synthase [Actinomadura luzonensis]MCK2213279.1 polyprenol monophosphomannose synthase [Actinomadura luzonensis]
MDDVTEPNEAVPWSLPSPWRDTRVAVVVPTYNEAGNIGDLAARVLALDLPRLRLVIADDDSPDGTGDLADDLAKQANAERPDSMLVLHRKVKEGIGRAHLAGMRQALALGDEYVVQMDGDLSHRPEYIPHLLGTILASRAGLVIGSRYVVGGSLSTDWGWHRRLLSRFAGRYVNAILNLSVRDPTGGFKIWRRDVLEGIGLDAIRSDGYSFQVEMNYRCKQLGHSIVELPIHFEERSTGSSKISFAVQVESMLTPFALRFGARRRPE